MGGLGSGQLAGGGRDVVEACRSIEVNRLQREGCLRPGYRGSWQWTQDGERSAWIVLRAEANRLHLSYRVRIDGGAWQEVEEAVRIARMPCRLGGARPYFLCPGAANGVVCGRRVAKLYRAGCYFLCRHCYNLAYASQSEDDLDRLQRRARKACQRLGDTDAHWFAAKPPRPKGMWRRTYVRLWNVAFEAEMRAKEMFEERLERLTQRHEQMMTRRRMS